MKTDHQVKKTGFLCFLLEESEAEHGFTPLTPLETRAGATLRTPELMGALGIPPSTSLNLEALLEVES